MQQKSSLVLVIHCLVVNIILTMIKRLHKNNVINDNQKT
jgi:hypothetical protein